MDRPVSVQAYLSAVPEPARTALETLRAQIRAAAPEATETISYQMPGFRQDGRMLVTYAAFRDHCSLFPMSVRVIDAHAEELAPYRAGKGTLRFTAERPIPAALVERLVRARIEENAARGRRSSEPPR